MKVYDLHHNVLYSRAFGIADVANTRWRVRYTRQRSVYIRPSRQHLAVHNRFRRPLSR
jgi:hypothetical protein